MLKPMQTFVDKWLNYEANRDGKLPHLHQYQGRVTIPAEFLERFRIKPGTIVTWRKEQGRLVLAPLTKKRLSKIVEFSKPQLGHRDKS